MAGLVRMGYSDLYSSSKLLLSLVYWSYFRDPLGEFKRTQSSGDPGWFFSTSSYITTNSTVMDEQQ